MKNRTLISEVIKKELKKIYILKEYNKSKKLTESNTNIGGPFVTDLENGPKNHGTRKLGNWESDNAWDVFAPAGSVVKSYTNGKVIRVKDSNTTSGKIYGTQVSLKGTDGYPDIFYTHLKNVNINVGDIVKIGDVIGEVSEWSDNMESTHVHIGLPVGNNLKDLLKNSDSTLKNPNNSSTTDTSKKESQNSTFLKNFERIIQSNKSYKNLKTETSKIPYSNDVEDIQIALQFLGFSLPKWGVDGLFGPETETSVKDFQKERGLTQNGIVDKEVLEEIYDMLIEEGFKDSDLTSIEKEYEFETKFSGKIGTAEEIIDFLKNKGLSIEQSVGIAANLYRESTFNPNAVGDNGTSFGIAQWHKERGQYMMRWTESKGYKSNSLKGQLEFLWYELSTDYKNVLDELKRTNTPEDAAEIFVRKYEIPSNIQDEVKKRSSIAGSLYNKVSDMV